MIRIKLGRKLVKVLGLYSSEVEHWSANPKVRGSNPRIAPNLQRACKKMTDVITVNRGSCMATLLRWSTKNIISRSQSQWIKTTPKNNPHKTWQKAR